MQAWKKSLVSLALALLTLSFLLWAHLLCPNAHNLKKVIEAWWYASTFRTYYLRGSLTNPDKCSSWIKNGKRNPQSMVTLVLAPMYPFFLDLCPLCWQRSIYLGTLRVRTHCCFLSGPTWNQSWLPGRRVTCFCFSVLKEKGKENEEKSLNAN